MSHTEMDRETCEVGYGLEQTDLETCPKSVWSPERRERLVSPIGDRLRVTRAREIRKRLTQAERKRKSVTKKAHGERETRASTRTNPVLSKGHPQDVAHPATVDPAESSSETELYSVASLSETVRFQPFGAGSVTKEREHVFNGKGSDSDGSRRRERVEPTPTREQTALGRRPPHFDHDAFMHHPMHVAYWTPLNAIASQLALTFLGNVFVFIGSVKFLAHETSTF